MAEISSSTAGSISLSEFMRGRGRSSSVRPFGKLPKRRYYLIVCEGEKTEPNYFEAIAALLPRGMVNHVVVKGTGKNTLSLIGTAQEEIARRKAMHLPPYYYVWLVFDKDSFPANRFNTTINTVADIDKKNAKEKRSEHWHSAWSNEAFELWYILHFRDQLGGAVSRTEFQQMIETEVRKQTGEKDFRYVKNDPAMFNRLRAFTTEAIHRAERALSVQMNAKGRNWSAMNPATRVHELVKSLLAYLR